MNIYWALKYSNGWIDPHCYFTRKDLIAAFLGRFKGGEFADKSWAWHKRHDKISAVRVEIKEPLK